MLKTIVLMTLFMYVQYSLSAQGCSDAGFCTVGNFNATHAEAAKQMMHKHEIDFSFIIGTHGRNERFYQPQLNYRFIKSNGFYEVRLPFNIAKNISTHISNRGIGDPTITYNSRFGIGKSNIDYSVGFRVSLTAADESDMKSMDSSYPMYLQSGLGTTDVLAVLNYDVGKYLSVGTGVQVPVFQYNKNVAILTDGAGSITGAGYRRMPDALLKLTGHYSTGQLRVSGGLLSIFHLANDHYNTSRGKYILQKSQGITINWNIELGYILAKNLSLGFLFAEPIVTRKNIPDGLARSRIYAPKITYAF